jgi:hypothetical protein
MNKYTVYLDNDVLNTFTNKAKAVKWAYNKVVRDNIDCLVIWQSISTEESFHNGMSEIYVCKEEVAEYDRTKCSQRHSRGCTQVQFLKGYGKVKYRGKRHGRKNK